MAAAGLVYGFMGYMRVKWEDALLTTGNCRSHATIAAVLSSDL